MVIFIFMHPEPFSYYFVFTKTLNLSNKKYKFGYINKYLPIKKYWRLNRSMISIIYNMGVNQCGYSSYFWS